MDPNIWCRALQLRGHIRLFPGISPGVCLAIRTLETWTRWLLADPLDHIWGSQLEVLLPLVSPLHVAFSRRHLVGVGWVAGVLPQHEWGAKRCCESWRCW